MQKWQVISLLQQTSSVSESLQLPIHTTHRVSCPQFCCYRRSRPTNFHHRRVLLGEKKVDINVPITLADLPTLSSVITLIAFPPLFCTRVRGMTSIASATARNGHTSTPVTLLAFACKPTAIAISVAPPPGAWRKGWDATLRAMDITSTRFRSISLRMSFEGPRRRIVHAFGAEFQNCSHG